MKVIAVFDVGKTNKKLFLFDEQYRIVAEGSASLPSAKDEDGEECEDLQRLTGWIREALAQVTARPDLQLKAVNFSAYGASFVHIGPEGRPVAPLYNYLKAYPEALQHKFYGDYEGEVAFSMLTASPVLGSLNSGMQLYRIKYEQPELWARIRYSLHLPQYLSYLITGKAVSEITSIGCHTNLWNFPEQQYHEWVYREGVIEKLAPIVAADSVTMVDGLMAGSTAVRDTAAGSTAAGVGLHDSSAAIIPYLRSFKEPFALISTGTWCITMNPFNDSPLTAAELQQDCLCYMSYRGRPVKASRLFAGYEHEQQMRRLAAHFLRRANTAVVRFDPGCAAALRERRRGEPASMFGQRELSDFGSYEQAYHCLIMDIMEQQVRSAMLVLRDTAVRRIYVDGGFARNDVYMHLLAEAFPGLEVYAASVPQATAMGAAMAIHEDWNKGVLPGEVIGLRHYGGGGG